MAWCDRLGGPGEYRELDRYLHWLGIYTGPQCYEQTTSGTDHGHAAGGNHPKGYARDFSYANGAEVDRIADVFLPLWLRGKLLELYYAPRGIWLPSNVGGHQDHLHAAIVPGTILVPRRRIDELVV